MKKLCFATTNKEKMQIALTVCDKFGMEVEQATVDIDEIQGEDPKIIVEDKVKRTYEQLRRPVVVSDDSWDIPALRGFPGPYMKSVNHWFTPDDFIRLMHGIEDREVILHQYLGYYDSAILEIFSNEIHGRIIDIPRGKNSKSPNMSVIELDHDNGRTIAEVYEQGQAALDERYQTRPDVWHKFVKWYAGVSEE